MMSLKEPRLALPKSLQPRVRLSTRHAARAEVS